MVVCHKLFHDYSKDILPIVHFKRLGSRHIHKEIEIS